MTPFFAWAAGRETQAVTENHVHSDRPTIHAVQAYEALLDSLVDNLSSASAAQLNVTLDVMGKRWAEQQANRMAERLVTHFSTVEARISSTLAEALSPVMSDVHLTQTIQEFAQTLRRLLPEFAGETVAVNAPQALQAKIATALAAEGIDAELRDTEEDSVSASNASVSLTAELGTWAERRLRAHAT
jgi:hypothetical protein